MEGVLKEYGMAVSKIFVLLMVCFCVTAHAQIYKIVDKDGNVTYTDQAPGDGTEPMDLPELSVVSTDYVEPAQEAVAAAPTEAEGEKELTRKDLRKLYRDFRISRPAPEETFWGTENTVVVAWESGEALQEGMSVRFNIDGKAQPASGENMMGITLDRGTHTVSATLLDGAGNSVTTTDTVTFYVHQQSVRGNGP
ncbi:MAG TPA: DUF4124 domain-containing protein [Xanthomonadales bacterium]|nr:DUF4124 domain-containing protein [Xanthomonadales bacterium]